MKKTLKKIIPKSVWELIRFPYYRIILKTKYRIFGRPYKPGETTKAKKRRIREYFFENYCKGLGLDVGYGGDLVVQNCQGWDFEHGDSQYLKGVPNLKFDFVYSSHNLEHMIDHAIALTNWWRVLNKGGYLILYIPHRDLYEKKKTLPSRWAPTHKHFFLLDRDEKPDTIGIIPLIRRTLSNHKIIYAKECSEGHTVTNPEEPSDGEYSIEVVVQKEYYENLLQDQGIQK